MNPPPGKELPLPTELEAVGSGADVDATDSRKILPLATKTSNAYPTELNFSDLVAPVISD
jgi:hypothetical protein